MALHLNVRAMGMLIWIAVAVCILVFATQCSAQSDWSPPAPPSPPEANPPANSPSYLRGPSPAYSSAPEGYPVPEPTGGASAPEGYPVHEPIGDACAPEGYPVVSPAYAPKSGM